MHEKPLPKQVANALQWCAVRTPQQRMRDRELAIEHIERVAEAPGSAGPIVRAVSQGVNGPLWEHLAECSSYHDPCAVDMFREGAAMTGCL